MGIATTVVFLALMGFGVWLLYDTRNLIRLGLSSYKWPRTEGTVVDSPDNSFIISGVGGTSGSSFDVPVEYKETVHDYVHEVAGHVYRCSTYCFGGNAENATAAYAIGAQVSVYFDPKHPEAAVLRRGIQLSAIIGLAPISGAFLLLYLSL